MSLQQILCLHNNAAVVRIDKLIRNIKKKDDESPLPIHFAEHHDGKPHGLVVKGIFVLNLPLRRGDFNTILLKKEKNWIFKLGTLAPYGLNTECNLQIFLES